MNVALVTCETLPEPDPDQEPLLDALWEVGLEPELLAWDDPGAMAPGDFDVCILRSTWNYYRAPEEFLAWIDRASRETVLVNPPQVVRWNLHKRYLLELEERGIPIVPTAWVERGTAADLDALLAEHGWEDVVVKPAVSAASFSTRRFRAGERDAARAFLAELAAERDALVQPYLPSVESGGERALVWIDGETTHAVTKTARFDGEDESVSDALPVQPAERDLAERALAGLDGLVYARLDLMADPEGRPLVSELELVEPSLFLVQNPAALRRLVDALHALARRRR